MTRHKKAPAVPNLADDRILSTEELLQRIPLTRQSLWRMSREGRFPAPIALTKSRIGWRWSSIVAWLASREANPERRPYFPTDNEKSA